MDESEESIMIMIIVLLIFPKVNRIFYAKIEILKSFRLNKLK